MGWGKTGGGGLEERRIRRGADKNLTTFTMCSKWPEEITVTRADYSARTIKRKIMFRNSSGDLKIHFVHFTIKTIFTGPVKLKSIKVK